MRLLALPSLAALLIPAAADARRADPQAELQKTLAGRVPGKPVDCISLSDIRGSRIIRDTGIVYRVGANRLYLNVPQSGADTLDDDDILVTRTFGGQLCRMDVVHLVDRASRFPRGFVGLGQFVPYTRPKAD